MSPNCTSPAHCQTNPCTGGCKPPDSLDRIVTRNIALRAFALRFLDPEDLGYVVNPCVRDAARMALGMQPVEMNRVPHP